MTEVSILNHTLISSSNSSEWVTVMNRFMNTEMIREEAIALFNSLRMRGGTPVVHSRLAAPVQHLVNHSLQGIHGFSDI